MDFVAYEFKRAHWSMSSTAKREFDRLAETVEALQVVVGDRVLPVMTPARYDIMHAIAERFWWDRKPGKRDLPNATMPMRDLVKMLGLHPSTISKTVALMRLRKLVVTSRSEIDKRQVLVSLTQAGWNALREARKVFRTRPQHFLREKHGTCFRRLGMKDAIGSMRAAQHWAKTLASAFGLESDPIHDPRCHLGWESACWWCMVFDPKRCVYRPPPPNVRRRAYS